MSLSKEEYLNLFLEHFREFIRDIARLFPNDEKVKICKYGLILFSQTAKVRCINAWKTYVIDNFRQEIEENNYNYFLENDEWESIIDHTSRDLILDKFRELKDSIKLLDLANKEKALKYVENLVKLCDLYNSATST